MYKILLKLNHLYFYYNRYYYLVPRTNNVKNRIRMVKTFSLYTLKENRLEFYVLSIFYIYHTYMDILSRLSIFDPHIRKKNHIFFLPSLICNASLPSKRFHR